MDRAGPKPVATPLSLSLRDNARKKLRISVIQSSYACIPAQTQMPSQGLSHAERTEASPPYHPQQADAQRILARMTRPGKPDLCLSAVPASRRCDRAPGAGKSACARGKGGDDQESQGWPRNPWLSIKRRRRESYSQHGP
jgi:hypothetical protein